MVPNEVKKRSEKFIQCFGFRSETYLDKVSLLCNNNVSKLGKKYTTQNYLENKSIIIIIIILNSTKHGHNQLGSPQIRGEIKFQ